MKTKILIILGLFIGFALWAGYENNQIDCFWSTLSVAGGFIVGLLGYWITSNSNYIISKIGAFSMVGITFAGIIFFFDKFEGEQQALHIVLLILSVIAGAITTVLVKKKNAQTK